MKMVITNERGSMLMETIVALGILIVVAAGVLPLGAVAVAHSENQGHLQARVTEYAQDKMEQLMALAFGDTITDTRVFPAATSGGTGLAPGGSSNPVAPVALYVDWLDEKGNLLTSTGTAAPANWFYERAWKVENVAGCVVVNTVCTLKRITVSTQVRNHLGRIGGNPIATLVQLKSSPF